MCQARGTWRQIRKGPSERIPSPALKYMVTRWGGEGVGARVRASAWEGSGRLTRGVSLVGCSRLHATPRPGHVPGSTGVCMAGPRWHKRTGKLLGAEPESCSHTWGEGAETGTPLEAPCSLMFSGVKNGNAPVQKGRTQEATPLTAAVNDLFHRAHKCVRPACRKSFLHRRRQHRAGGPR